jgi:hypothetical protein
MEISCTQSMDFRRKHATVENRLVYEEFETKRCSTFSFDFVRVGFMLWLELESRRSRSEEHFTTM